MSKTRAPKLCTYRDFADKLPHSIPRRQFLRLSDLGKAPPYTRPSFKGEPLFLESDVLAWIREKYGKLLPSYVARVEKEGLADASRPFNAESL